MPTVPGENGTVEKQDKQEEARMRDRHQYSRITFFLSFFFSSVMRDYSTHT